jgi:RNA polymerase sigma factor (sigma-70 family)
LNSGDDALTLPAALNDRDALRRAAQDLVVAAFKVHYGSLVGYLAAAGVRSQDADDLAQEAFLRLYSAIFSGEKIECVRHWLFRVVRNLRVDRLRTRKWEIFLSPREWLRSRQPRDTALSPEASVLNLERLSQLENLMRGLTPVQFEYLYLRMEGCTYREIAGIYKVSIATVADVCARALVKLGAAANE